MDDPNMQPTRSREGRVANSDCSQGTRLSIVIPAYNEQATIRQAIDEAKTALETLVDEFEIIVVDDGCTDRTSEIVLEESASDSRVRLLRQPRNLGYGAALRAGFQAARFDLVAFTDADCQFELSDLGYMLPLTDRFDIVSGYRIDRKDPPIRRFYSWGYNTLVQLLMGSRIRDIDCALKIYHRSSLPQILPDANNFFANTEMLTKARSQDLSVVDVGVRHRPRAAGESKVSIRHIPETLKSLLPFWWKQVLFNQETSASLKIDRQFWAALLFLMALASALLFPNLNYPLIEPDEGRYAEIAREMISSGDWIVPTLNFEPYLDKPPLFYWMCAVSYKIFGPLDWAARLVPATSAFLTVLLTFLGGSRILGTRSGFLGAVTMCLSLGFVCCGRFMILDSLLTLLVTLSLFLAYAAIGSGRFRWGCWIGSAMACGLGFLTKGPVALLLIAPPIVVFSWLSVLKHGPRLKEWAAYVFVAMMVAAPWYIAVSLREPGFVHHFFWVHNFGRFLYSVNHPQPTWFYLPVLLLAWMPWGLLLAPLAVFVLKRSKELRADRPLSLGYFLLWAGWCVTFFSLSKGKLPPYILPAWPAIALSLGHYLGSMGALSARRLPEWNPLHSRFQIGILGLCIAGSIGSLGAYFLQLEGSFEASYEMALWIAALTMVVLFHKRWSPRVLCGAFCAIAFVATFETMQDSFPAWGYQHATMPMESALKEEIRNSPATVISCGNIWGSIPFYLQRDDVHHFPKSELRQLTTHIDMERNTYLVLNGDITLDEVSKVVSPKMELDIVWQNRKVKIVHLNPRQSGVPGGELFDLPDAGGQRPKARIAEAESSTKQL